jgi:hypothetical protein
LARNREIRCVDVRFGLETGGETSVVIQREACAAHDASNAPSSTERDREFDGWLAFLWPNATFRRRPPHVGRFSVEQIVVSEQTSFAVRALKPMRTIAVQDTSSPAVIESLSKREFDVSAALDALSAFAPCEFVLRISPVAADGRMVRALDRLEALNHSAAAHGDRGADDTAATERFLRAMRAGDYRATRIEAVVCAASPVPDLALDLVSFALFGAPAQREEAGTDTVDLRGLWPAGWGPHQLTSLGLERASRRLVFSAASPPNCASGGGVRLGDDLSGHAVRLSHRDRMRHLYVIGATGTGKSSLLLEMIKQDLEADECVIVLDPHGDLADAARACVPERRRPELVWCDFADLRAIPAVNILSGQGGTPAFERNYVCYQLIHLFSRVLYRGVPEAFGPMFETYFRNGLMLLMDAGGEQATLMDFERVFHDASYRNGLVNDCSDAKIREFWRDVAERASSDEIRLENIAPYIVSKLTQLTGNPLMRRVVGQRQSTLDFRVAMDNGGVVLLKLAKGIVGETDATILATLMVVRMAQACMSRAALAPDRRRPARVYVDEFQVCAGESLGDMLAESRKYGVSLALANQSLTQVDGKGWRNAAGEAALANAANLVAFRVGAPDAARLAPWFAPEIDWRRLCALPDFHAAVRTLGDGRPAAARIMTTADARAAPGAE